MKALVTGANGFLGSWIVKGLLKRKISVRILNRTSSDLTALKGLVFESAIGDITDFKSLLKATEGIDYVFHVAGLISYHQRDREKMELVNVTGTKNVVEACIQNKVRKLIHTSSVVAIGASAKPEVFTEESPYNLSRYNMGYFETKKKAEDLVIRAARENKLFTVTLNPSSMFGPGDATKSSRKKYLRVSEGKFPYYPSGGVNILDVEDAVEGHLLAMEKGRSGERYILGAENITVKKLFDLFAQSAGVPAPNRRIPKLVLKFIFYLGKFLSNIKSPLTFAYENAMIGSLYHWYDHSKAKRELGFNPRPAEQAIKRSVQWSINNGLLKRTEKQA